MERQNNDITVDYYIIFTKSEYKHWMFKFIDPNFQHVYAVKKSPGGNFWIIINPMRGFTDVTMESINEYPSIRALCPDQIILSIRAKANNKCRQWFGHVNCVEIVKTLLGLNNRFLITPFQLYKYLAR